MASITTELFLYSCINHANSGKINFVDVGLDCGMKPGTAAMRWRRFKEKLDTSPLKGAVAEDDGGDAVPKVPKTKGSKNGDSKKRKLDDVDDTETTPVKAEKDDDEV